VTSEQLSDEVSSPAELRLEGPRRQNRWTVLFRLLLSVPQLVVLYFVSIAAGLVLIVGWFAALVTGRLPESLAAFLRGYLRWSLRVMAYLYLLTDRYPPFSLGADDAYPVDLEVRGGRLNRLSVLLRIILVIPVGILLMLALIGAEVFGVINWVGTLLKGEQPRSFFEAYGAILRYVARVHAFYSMLTSVYPTGLRGEPQLARDEGPEPAPRDWDFVLTREGRTLVTVLVVLGLVASIGYGVVVAALSGPLSASSAREQTTSAYGLLAIQANQYESQALHCEASTISTSFIVVCLQANDKIFSSDVVNYHDTLSSIAYPSAVQPQSSAAIAAAGSVEVALRTTSTSGPTPADYQAAVESSKLARSLSRIDTTYGALDRSLARLERSASS
jgi:hypothetical protein